MEQERLPIVQKMILAADEKERRQWLAKLLPFQRSDFVGILKEMHGQEKILPVDPFESLDTTGVGRRMQIAVEEGRKARCDLEIGICGEHGGDPASIHFCHTLGLNYVSCSPYRVPVARLAAAQAAMTGGERDH